MDQLMLDFPTQPANECKPPKKLQEGLRAQPKAVLKGRIVRLFHIGRNDWAKRSCARQISKRGGELLCQDRGDRAGIGGNAVIYVEGKVHLRV
jgi:hypothetical protein